MSITGSVPSATFENGLSTLDRLLPGKRSVSAAVAFVSESGAQLLDELLTRHHCVEELRVVARGAPITEPDALLLLRDRLGAKVSVIVGEEAVAFHPKLWLLRGKGELHVLSGSGNLTEGGLLHNREQFEVLHFTEAAAIASQEQRFDGLTANPVSLDRFENSIAWREWKDQMQRRAEIAEKVRQLDDRLAISNPISRDADREQLMRDLWDIYERVRAERLRLPTGALYVPGGLRLQLEGRRGVTDPVRIAANICRTKTDGFNVILEADKPELTVEWLVADKLRPYHDLFEPDTVNRSVERLRQFPSWPGD